MRRRWLEDLVKKIYAAGAFKTGEFRLTSGLPSPYYVDLRILISRPKIFSRLVDSYIWKIRGIKKAFDVIAGVETAGISVATLLSYKMCKPMVYVRSTEKTHGTRKRVEGELSRGDKVIIVDDVLTTGGSIMEAASGIRESGGEVVYAIVFLDRLQNGAFKLREIGIEAYSVIDAAGFVEILHRNRLIPDSEYVRIMDYLGSVQKCGRAETS
ncbi:MAG: orotate phosphoribosyltransferase [Thermoproteota archaeon]